MVEWKKLNDLLDFEQPTQYLVKSTEYNDTFNTPVLTAGQSLLLGYTDENDGIYKADKKSPTIIFDDFTTSFHWIDYNFKVKSTAMKMLRPKSNVCFRYVFYAMKCIGFIPSGHQRHWIAKYSQFQIPIPSLQEQERIVSILDTFTASIENIKAQIEQRCKQYDHYRNSLLTFNKDDDSVEWKTLGEISYRICSGGTPLRDNKDFFNGTIPWLRTQEVDWRDVYDTEIKITQDAIAKSSAKLIPENCVIIAMYGATAGKSCINKIPLTTNQACCNLQINDSISLYKYVYHYICKDYNKLKALGEGSQNNISAQKIKSYKIPIPPLARQQEIVSTLDTFEASIVNLEAQLEQRQKQYEYYREKLITPS